jgi:hypothetical protein
MGDTRQNEFADLLATYRVGKKPLSPQPNGSFGATPARAWLRDTNKSFPTNSIAKSVRGRPRLEDMGSAGTYGAS